MQLIALARAEVNVSYIGSLVFPPSSYGNVEPFLRQ